MEYLSKQRYDEIEAELNHLINVVYPQVRDNLAETVNILVDEMYLGEDGKPQVEKMNLITYEPVRHGYLVLGERVGNAFSDGKKFK